MALRAVSGSQRIGRHHWPTRSHPLAIGRPGQAGQAAPALEGAQLATERRIPERDEPAGSAAHGQGPPIRGPGDVNDGVAVPFEHAERLAGVCVPQPGGAIMAAGGGKGVAVRRPGQTINVGSVPNESSDQLARFHVPDVDDPIQSPGGHLLAVGADGKGDDVPPMPFRLHRPVRDL